MSSCPRNAPHFRKEAYGNLSDIKSVIVLNGTVDDTRKMVNSGDGTTVRIMKFLQSLWAGDKTVLDGSTLKSGV